MLRKVTRIICLVVFVSSGVSAQVWSPVGGGITSTAANTTWALYTDDSVMYAGGWFNNAGGNTMHDIAQWNGSAWATVNTGTNGYISAFAVYNGNVYAGGKFDTIGGVVAHDIARWNGTTWSPVAKGIKDVQYGVYAMAVYNGELYVGGSFDTVDGKLVFGIAKWNDTAWSTLGKGIFAADESDGVFALAVYNSELYVGGGFDTAGGIPVKEIARWNGTAWSSVGGSMNDGGSVNALQVYNGNLYAGGMFDTAGGAVAHRVAMWNGSVWSALDSGIRGENGWADVNCFAVYNGELYVGGYFDTVNNKPINCIARWDGTAWSTVSTGIALGGSLDAMTVYGNSLYVGGGFDSAGGVYAKNIAMWTTPNAISNLTENISVALYPNPSNNYITVSSTTKIEGLPYIIYNSMGQEVARGVFNKATSINTIDVQGFAEGVYLIRSGTAAKEFSARFIKVR